MKKSLSFILIVGIIALIFVIMLGSSMFITLSPGEKGVVFRKFSTGLDKENIYDAGFHVVAPWNTMFVYDVREQKAEEELDVLDKSGLNIKVDVTIRFNPMYNKIGYLHEKFGPSYITTLINPEVRSVVRKVMGRYTAEEIYSTKRSEVEGTIIKEAEEVLKSPENNIQMTALLIRSIKLPDEIRLAIENKLKQEQEALAYKFKLDREQSEAQRKRIEAEGSSAANLIITRSLTEPLLRMRGIEATLELAKSPNSKIVVVGGKDGLPLILGNQ
jgi:regulator of protease activity HflC (stomatin/prohibitin superfamily)